MRNDLIKHSPGIHLVRAYHSRLIDCIALHFTALHYRIPGSLVYAELTSKIDVLLDEYRRVEAVLS